ncbi:TIGR02587 family membrane protein [Limoniibacter endophyticus]|uniref:Membrane protein n=1 Tax=Limoniibacter endophyticus TaxID=1565040 RepID=A0A8J3GHU6_9HYPH|nr:TIGR02587 family membrane protein [Limoniibacter endophyticus]GHC73125.1 membrane protein [Limoniibacter endophyticus]
MQQRTAVKSASFSKLARDTGRATGGAIVFSLPMLMTMEMWWLGFYMDRLRLVLLLALSFPLFLALSSKIGFERTSGWIGDLVDTLYAFTVGAVVSALILLIFGVLTHDMAFEEWTGKIALQTVPAALGALLARSQLGTGDRDDHDDEEEETLASEVLFMAVGALFLGFNVAPTEEMLLISFQMSEWHALALIAASLLLMHGFVFALDFKGGTEIGEGLHHHSFLIFTVTGYVLALLISLYCLWTFGRLDGLSFEQAVMATVVLGFPSAIGAAAARLIL